MEIRGKKISILGAVRSGLGAAKLSKKLGAVPFVSDSAPGENLRENLEVLEAEKIKYETGIHSGKVFDCDLIVTSPGVPSGSAVLQDAFKKNIKVVSELEFASWFCKGKIIAVTGTNGKTTTASLCAHTFNVSGRKAFLAGNVGNAFSETVLDINEDDYAVLEVSSFQLDHIDTFKPFISVILNIRPDHMDRYDNDLKKYIQSKINIIKNQGDEDFFIYNADDPNIAPFIKNENVNKYTFSLKTDSDAGTYYKDNGLYFSKSGSTEKVCQADDLFIKGEHNIANALPVLAAAKLCGISSDDIKKAFETFKGVEHRLEFVREIDGVRYINDSKATNVDSVWYALRSFENKIFLILGGKDKGNDYDQIKKLVINNVKKIYAIGSSADKVMEYFGSIVPVEKKKTLEDCVMAAKQEASENEIVLLSPACASFDMFDNYEHRGKVFKEAVNNLN